MLSEETRQKETEIITVCLVRKCQAALTFFLSFDLERKKGSSEISILSPGEKAIKMSLFYGSPWQCSRCCRSLIKERKLFMLLKKDLDSAQTVKTFCLF